MLRTRLIVFIVVFSAGLAACRPVSTPLPPLPTSTSLPPTETPTPTVVWFPPTATITPRPMATMAVTPTLDLSPIYGEEVFREDFSDPQAWTQGRYSQGVVAPGVNELSLAVNQERGYVSSLLQGFTLENFYLEISANPSICRGNDEYGLLLRIQSSQDFFRFGLTCDGQARLDRLLGGVASAPHPPSFSGAVPPGAPSFSRLGVWALDREMRFYANGQFLFSVRDSSILSGSLGLYVRSAATDAITVNFSDLVIYQVSE